jgi:toxin CcdB
VARYDVYANPVKSEVRHTPYLIDLQNDFLHDIDTRIVAPLHSFDLYQHQSERVRQIFEINEEVVVLDIAAMASIPKTLLKKKVANLYTEQHHIQAAIDTIFGAH